MRVNALPPPPKPSRLRRFLCWLGIHDEEVLVRTTIAYYWHCPHCDRSRVVVWFEEKH